MGSPVYLFGNRGGAQQQPQPSFVDTLMARFMAGLQIAQTLKGMNAETEARKQQIEQNKLQMEMMKHQLQGASLQEKLAPLQAQIEIAKLLQGLPGQQVGGQMAPGMPGLANVPESLGGPGGTQAGPPMQGMFDVPRPPVNVDLGSAFPGAGQFQIPIQTQQQSLQQALMQQAQQGQIEARTAGMKASAEAGAKAPYEQALEGLKADTARGNQEYVQGQENLRAKLSSNTSLSVASLNREATREQRKFDQGNKLSDDFFKETAPFTAMDDAYAKVKAAAAVTPTEDPTGASDVAILYGYMKLLDPNSAVREGEVALAGQTQGIPDRILTMYNNAINGQKLAPAARANFVAAAKKTYEAVQPRLKMIEGRYQDTAKKSGLDPNRFKFQSGATQQPPAPAPVPNGAVVTDPNGRRYRIVNGQPVPIQ